MCVQNLLGGPKLPTLPPPVEPKTPVTPDADNSGAQVADARRKTRAAAALSQGRGSNILTGSGGLGGPATTAKKQTLGA